MRLSGVNSINWGRIVAQIVYYFTAAVSLGSPHRPVNFVVPTGNFGNIFAGYAAKRMGLPIASGSWSPPTSNDILAPHASRPAATKLRGVTPPLSPSMDIQVSSNFERLLFEAARSRCRSAQASDDWPCPVGQPIHLRHKPSPAIRGLCRRPRQRSRDLRDDRARPPQTTAYLLDPHYRCRRRGGPSARLGDGSRWSRSATAHPAKFPAAVKAASGC